jgi:hypothetical protein
MAEAMSRSWPRCREEVANARDYVKGRQTVRCLDESRRFSELQCCADSNRQGHQIVVLQSN